MGHTRNLAFLPICAILMVPQLAGAQAAAPPSSPTPGTAAPVVWLAVPTVPTPAPEPKTRRNSVALMTAGMATSAVGLLGINIGAALLFSTMGYCDPDTEAGARCLQDKEHAVDRGRLFVFVGAGVAAAGVPMIVLGARSVPAEATERGGRRQPERVGSPHAELVLGASGLSLRGEF